MPPTRSLAGPPRCFPPAACTHRHQALQDLLAGPAMRAQHGGQTSACPNCLCSRLTQVGTHTHAGADAPKLAMHACVRQQLPGGLRGFGPSCRKPSRQMHSLAKPHTDVWGQGRARHAPVGHVLQQQQSLLVRPPADHIQHTAHLQRYVFHTDLSRVEGEHWRGHELSCGCQTSGGLNGRLAALSLRWVRKLCLINSIRMTPAACRPLHCSKQANPHLVHTAALAHLGSHSSLRGRHSWGVSNNSWGISGGCAHNWERPPHWGRGSLHANQEPQASGHAD